MSNSVEHPAHYNVGKIEVIDAINEWQLDFNLGNVVKYVARAGHKDKAKTIEDLKKAKFYLEDSIERLQGQFSETKQNDSYNNFDSNRQFGSCKEY